MAPELRAEGRSAGSPGRESILPDGGTGATALGCDGYRPLSRSGIAGCRNEAPARAGVKRSGTTGITPVFYGDIGDGCFRCQA